MRNVPTTEGRPRARRWGVLANSLIVMGGYILSRLLGLVRDLVISSHFGTLPVADAYSAAFKIPDLLYLVIIGGALGSAFIPIFSELLTRDGEERAWQLASEVMNLALLALVCISLLVALFADPLVGLLAPTFEAEQRELTASLMRIFLLSPLLLGLGGLAMATLNALDRYTLSALAPALYNLCIIGGTLFLAPSWGIYGVAWGVVAGALLYLLIQLPGLLRAGMRYKPSLGWRDGAVRRVGKLMAPRVFGQSAMQINIIVMASIASVLGAGRIRALDLAYQLMLLPHGVFALSLGTVSFPAMARAYAAGDLSEVAKSMRDLLRSVLWTVVPASVALGVLGVPLVRIFQRGNFTDESVRLVAGALIVYATALPAFAASEILIRTFYAMQDTRRPVLAGLATVGINILLSLLLVKGLGYGHRALAASFSIANNLEALLLLVMLRRKLGGLDPDGRLRRSVARTLAGALGAGAALAGLLLLSTSRLPWLTLSPEAVYNPGSDLPLLLGWLCVSGAMTVAVYAGLSLVLGSEELLSVGGRLVRRLRRS